MCVTTSHCISSSETVKSQPIGSREVKDAEAEDSAELVVRSPDEDEDEDDSTTDDARNALLSEEEALAWIVIVTPLVRQLLSSLASSCAKVKLKTWLDKKVASRGWRGLARVAVGQYVGITEGVRVSEGPESERVAESPETVSGREGVSLFATEWLRVAEDVGLSDAVGSSVTVRFSLFGRDRVADADSDSAPDAVSVWFAERLGVRSDSLAVGREPLRVGSLGDGSDWERLGVGWETLGVGFETVGVG